MENKNSLSFTEALMFLSVSDLITVNDFVRDNTNLDPLDLATLFRIKYPDIGERLIRLYNFKHNDTV